jgi:CRP-like cAMP-binding protein
MESLSILKRVPLLQSLGDADLADLSVSIRVQRLREKQVLFRKGDEGTALYIIKKGKIKIVLPSKVGEEVILTIFSEGDFLGEMSLLDEKPRSADGVAMEESEVYVLNRTDFLSFLQKNENAIRCILSSLSGRLRKTDDLLEDTSFLGVSARLSKKLVELGREFGTHDKNVIRIGLRLTQQDLADLVGTTRESINKELKVLRGKGLVSTEGGYIHLLDLERLKRRVH